MSTKTIPSQDLFPTNIDPSQLQKGLGCGANLLTRHVPKRPNPSFHPGTVSKLLDTVIMQMAARCSAGVAGDILSIFQEVICLFLQGILALPDPLAGLIEVSRALSHNDTSSIFGVSPPTLSAHLDRFPVKEADLVLRDQLDIIQVQMRKQGTWPAEVMLAADPTDVAYRGRFHNQYTTYGRVGNQPTWKRGFKEFGIYACPTQLQVGFAPVQVGGNGGSGTPAWVGNVASAVKWVTTTGSTVPVVALDREFYSALSFGVARAGLLAPGLAASDQPRLLCPTKFWHSNGNPKWEFLTGGDSADVVETTLKLGAREAMRLGPAGECLKSKDGAYLVPVAIIAGFDTYPGKHAPKTLAWARDEARHADAQLRAAQAALVKARRAHETYTKEVLQVKRGLPGGKGRKRQSFADDEEATRYWAYLDARGAVTKWEGKKGRLMKRLTFFTASMREGEHVTGHESQFRDLIRQYREHWNIENGYKSQKHHFRMRTNNRKTTARHMRGVLGAMFYNAWHYRRLSRAARVAKKSEPGWKPFDPSAPLIRKKWEREIRPALSAQGFLLEELKVSLQVSIKQFLAQISTV
jgi:DNA-binding transcriptional ArsR family regulator